MADLQDAAADPRWMRQASTHAIAAEGTDPAEMSIAAVVVRDGKLLACGVNRTADDCEPPPMPGS